MKPALPTLLTTILLAAAASAASGGPDVFGYTWIDSNEPLGPVFMGFDISGTGTALGGGDDVLSAPIAMSGAFDFYGLQLADVVMSTNGYVTDELVGSALDTTNDCPLPAAPSTGGGARIYALHDDLFTPGMFTQYFASCPRPADRGSGPIGCTIFQWDDAEHLGTPGVTWDMWAILYDNDDIVYEVGPGNPEQGSDSTTGIQDGAASDGLTVACDTATSIPDSHAVLIEAPCSAGGGLLPPSTALVVSGPTIIDGALGTIGAVLDPAYRGNGIFSFTSIDIQVAGTVTFAGTSAVELRSSGPVTIDGMLDLSGTNGNPSDNGQPGGDVVAGVAGAGFGGRGGCRADWRNKYGQRGGGASGGFGGTTPGPGGSFDDVTGGGGGGNVTAGLDSDPPRSGSSPVGQGGCASFNPLTYPLRGGPGGAGGGCDVDDPTPGPPGANDGGAGGGSGGGGLRVQAGGDITIGATAMLLANGGNGGTSGGNGGSGGGGAGGTLLFVSAGNIVDDGAYSLHGGLGGLIGQANATSGGGPGGAGFLGLYDADGVIGGTRTIMVPAASPPPMGARATPVAVTGTSPVFGSFDLRITNVDLPDAAPMMPYTARIVAAGGSGSYTFMVTAGGPPAGISLDPMTGDLTGASTVAAQSLPDTFTVTVDDGSTTFDRQFCIHTLDQTLGISTSSLPAVDPLTAYMETIMTVGGTPPLTFEVVDGSLPVGLTLDTATGVISGMTGAAPEDTYFGIQVTGTFNEGTSMTYNVSVGGSGGGSAGAIVPLAPAQECEPYRAPLVPTGGTPPYRVEIIAGVLPAGLTLDTFGFVSGIPMVGSAGVYPICVYAYDGYGFVGNGEVLLTVTAPGTSPSCAVSVSSPPVPSCSLPALAIPDNDPLGVTDTISVPMRGILTGISVDVDIAHTWVGDLRIELMHVSSGTTVVLTDRPGVPASGISGCGEDDIDCTFTDTAAFAAEDMCGVAPALEGLALADGPLAAFIGLDVQSDWTLLVSDNAAADLGTLDGWCLHLTAIGAPQAGAITLDIAAFANCDPTFDLDAVSYSIDGGMTFFPCTPAPGSPTTPPQIGLPTGATTFLWSSSADGVATALLETNVVLEAMISGSTASSSCQTPAFEVDNRCLCGDCDASGALPVTVLDALVGAQFAAGLGTPSSLQVRCCDVDSSGAISILDALVMAQTAAGLPVSLMCP